MRIRQSLPQPHILKTETQVPWKPQRLGAGVWGLWSNPRARTAVDCRDTDPGCVREETVVGNACGRKPGSHGRRRCCWVTQRGWSHYHSLSLPTHQHQPLNSTEAGPSNAWCIELQSRTPVRGPFYVPEVPNNREGPQAREPSKCLKGQGYGERPAKDAFWLPATKRPEERLWEGHNSCGGGSPCPCTLGTSGSSQVKQLCHLHTHLSLGQSQEQTPVSAHMQRWK